MSRHNAMTVLQSKVEKAQRSRIFLTKNGQFLTKLTFSCLILDVTLAIRKNVTSSFGIVWG